MKDFEQEEGAHHILQEDGADADRGNDLGVVRLRDEGIESRISSREGLGKILLESQKLLLGRGDNSHAVWKAEDGGLWIAYGKGNVGRIVLKNGGFGSHPFKKIRWDSGYLKNGGGKDRRIFL